MDEILDVDLIAFEQGTDAQRRAVVDGVMQSLRNGFVYTSTDLSEDLLDSAYGLLEQFFSLPAERKLQAVAPGTHGQTGYTGLLVETAATSDVPDWKEMLNWGDEVPLGHPLQRKYPARYPRRVLPETAVPGITEVLAAFHERVLDVQRRFLRIVALGIGCAESFFEAMTTNGTTLTRAIHYPPMESSPGCGHVWAAEHADINLITALPRATARGLQVRVGQQNVGRETVVGETVVGETVVGETVVGETVAMGWIDATPPEGHVIINTGIMLEHLTNGLIPSGIHRVVADPDQPGDRFSVVQFAHPTPWTILSPVPSCITPENPQRFAPIEAGDRLDQVLYEINLVEDARRVP